MHLREVWTKFQQLAAKNQSALEVFNAPKGFIKVFKYHSPEGIVYAGVSRTSDYLATPIATVIRHPNGNWTKVKAGVTSHYIKPNNGNLKV